jgi:hypothetical protein
MDSSLGVSQVIKIVESGSVNEEGRSELSCRGWM